jgi:hypothetical protein
MTTERTIAITLLYQTKLAWLHHTDQADANQSVVLAYDFRVHDSSEDQTRYECWLEVIFRDLDSKIFATLALGPERPVNVPSANLKNRWYFRHEAQAGALQGSMELVLRQVAKPGVLDYSDPELHREFKDYLGHLLEPSSKASGSPKQKRVPLGVKPTDRQVYNVYVVDRFESSNKGHRCWGTDSDEEIVKAIALECLQKELTEIARGTNKYSGVKAHWVTSPPTDRRPEELLVYLSAFTGPPARFVGPQPAAHVNHTGSTTKSPKGYVVEAYPGNLPVDASAPKLGGMLSRVILHEWMHVVLDAGGQTSLVRESPDPDPPAPVEAPDPSKPKKTPPPRVTTDIHEWSYMGDDRLSAPVLTESNKFKPDEVRQMIKHLATPRSFA